jgi:cell division protein FtsI/penicillin-binding protein 2
VIFILKKLECLRYHARSRVCLHQLQHLNLFRLWLQPTLVMTLTQPMTALAEYQVGTRAFQNFESKAQGRLSMKKAMAISCDTIWYKIAFAEWLKDGGLRPKANPNDYFFKAAEGFQIGQKTGIDLPSESSGRLANREWRKSWYEAE